ncbi:hypothetical protein [Streptomyces sp. NPDC088910]|uniref:hypothetical protein n=1 Tax=Streptomyces sp. NPDC088910 TaxID=3365911 RepID=UPI0037F4D846
MSAAIYGVREPVHWLLEQVDSAFMQRQIAREVGRQLRTGTDPERLAARLRARFAAAVPADIREPGRWLLGVALPRWGCGLEDCEAGVLWSTGARCEVCASIVADRRRPAASSRACARGHGAAADRSGACPGCEDDRVPRHAVQIVPGGLDNRPRGACCNRGARIFLTGAAVFDGLCKPCRQEQEGRVIDPAPGMNRVTCTGLDGVPCDRPALPTQPVCRVHRAQQVALAERASL